MKTIFLIALVFLSSSAFAHQDVICLINKGNMHLEYLSGGGKLEIEKKIRIFAELSDKLIKSKFPNSEQLYIYFGHNYSDTSYYALGYGQFTFWDYEKSSMRNAKTDGIIIIIRDQDFDIKRTLLLINAAFSNIEFIKRNQSEYVFTTKYHYLDTVSSIPFAEVEKYMALSDPVIDEFLSEKYYRNLRIIKEDGAVDYYFQNNQFHFYDTKEEEWSGTEKAYVVNKTFGEDFLTVDNVFEIFGSVNDGHFVFIDDSTFYFIPQLKEEIRGPFIIDGIKLGRPAIEKYYHEYSPIQKFILFFDKYPGYRKVLFVPDSNLVVSNYDSLENNLINSLLKKTTNKEQSDNSNTTIIILSILLGCCSVIIISLLIKQKK